MPKTKKLPNMFPTFSPPIQYHPIPWVSGYPRLPGATAVHGLQLPPELGGPGRFRGLEGDGQAGLAQQHLEAEPRGGP